MKKKMIGFFVLLVSVAGLAISCGKDSTPPPESSLTVTEFYPLSARPGETVVISGAHFGTTPAENSVTLNNIPASVVSASANELRIVVPDNLNCSGSLKVTVGGKSFTTPVPFVFMQGDIVYVGGYEERGTSRSLVCWQNGIPFVLDTELDLIELNDLFVSNSDVYAVGNSYAESILTAALWKNGTKTFLSDFPRRTSAANGIFVSGGDVYVAGNERFMTSHPDPSSWNIVATYWKNGTKHPLSPGVFSSNAVAVGVRGGDVCVAGNEYDVIFDQGMVVGVVNQAVLWVNGTKTLLGDGDKIDVVDLFVDGSDVYVAGWQSLDNPMKIVLWKNGVKIWVSGDSEHAYPTSLFVSNGNVYMSGYEWQAGYYASTAVLWKNGTKQTLGQSDSRADQVVVVGENVYVAGTEEQTAVLWKNGQKSVLGMRGGSSARALYVVPGQ